MFRFPTDTARAEAGEERREVNRGIGEQSQWAVVQEEFLGGGEYRMVLRVGRETKFSY